MMQIKTLKVYVLALLLGVLTGILGSYFQMAIKKAQVLYQYGYRWLSQHGMPKAYTAPLWTMLMVLGAWYLVKRFAPEASGSGVQEIEGALLHQRRIFWKRLIPVKFIAGVMAISSKLVLGREGPTIQMGGNLGEMLGGALHISRERTDTLVSAGAAAGLATAFNAPLAGVLFVIEEMRNQFNFTFTNFKMVALACVSATITTHYLLGSAPAIAMTVFELPGIRSLWIFFIFGIFVGFAGWLFNVVLMQALRLKDQLSFKGEACFSALVGAFIGLAVCYYPSITGGGYDIIHHSLVMSPPTAVLLALTVLRFITTVACYSTGVPGGIFAPMLALGTLMGLLFYQAVMYIAPDATIYPGMLAVAGMGALFSAAVRAPITGIVLVVEMTQNYLLILPLMVTCLTSTTVIQLAKNAPIYTQLLHRTLKNTTRVA